MFLLWSKPSRLGAGGYAQDIEEFKLFELVDYSTEVSAGTPPNPPNFSKDIFIYIYMQIILVTFAAHLVVLKKGKIWRF